MNSRLLFLALFAILFGSAFCQTIKLHVAQASSQWWIAVDAQNDNSATVKLEMLEGSSSTWTTALFDPAWGYFALSATSGTFKMPLSFRLTSSSGSQVVAMNLMTSITPNTVYDTLTSFGGAASAATATSKPAAAATSKPAAAATSKPITSTPAPTPAPAAKSTPAPTSAPTVSLCSVPSATSEPMQLLVPLYVYPGAAWDQLIATASTGVKIVAVINPNSGPNPNGPDSAYKAYMQKFANAGIDMVGYVHTSFGARDQNSVLSDVNTYGSLYPLVKGIFFDEASASASFITYYTTLYKAVQAKKWVHTILNPGTQPDQGYLAISTNIVIFENYATSLGSINWNSWVQCAPNAASKSDYKYKFSAVIHSALLSDMPWLISQVYQKGIGMVYVTDQPGGCCTYNYLSSYFSTQSTTIKTLNINNSL